MKPPEGGANRPPASRTPYRLPAAGALDDETDIIWLEDPLSFLYVREIGSIGPGTLRRDPPPKRGNVAGRLVAYPVHRRRRRAYRWTRFWYVAPWDPYEGAELGVGPVEAVIPDSIAPGRLSLSYSLLRWRP